MKESKLIRILSTLRPKEIEHFQDLLHTSYFSTKPETLELWAYLYPTRQKSKNPLLEFDKATVLEKVFAQKQNSDKALRVCMSELTRHLELFLVMNVIKKDQLLRKKLTIKALKQRMLYEQFTQAIDQLIAQHPEKKMKTSRYHLDLMQLHHDYFFHPNTPRKENHSIQNAMDHLDAFYVLRKLRYSCELLNRHLVLADTYHIKLLEEVRQTALASLAGQVPLCRIYLKLIEIFIEGYSSENYQKVKEDLLHYQKEIPPAEQQIILYYLININNRQVNQDNMNLVREGLELYKIGLNYHILTLNKEMSFTTYINIVNNGSALGEFKWTKQFIDQYRKSLHKSLQKDGYQSAMAIYYFHKGDHKEVPLAINELKFTKDSLTLLLRSMLLRSYYELEQQSSGYASLFVAELENFYRYLKYHEYMREDQKQAFENFRSFTNKLASTRRKGSVTKKKKEELHQLLKELRPIAAAQWLRNKIDEL